MLSRFHLIPECNGWTDGRTDGRAYLLYQNIYIKTDKKTFLCMKINTRKHNLNDSRKVVETLTTIFCK